MVGKVTFDIALERFESAPHLPGNAATLLTIATRYWHDGMIQDSTYAAAVCKVRNWLREAPIYPSVTAMREEPRA